MNWYAVIGDALWILTLSLIASGSRAAWARIRPDARVPMQFAPAHRVVWRASKPFALLFTPALATLVALALGWSARDPSAGVSAPLVVLGARVALAPVFLLAHLMHLQRALAILADEGGLK